MTDLHCNRRRHARVFGNIIEIHCRGCSSDRGEPVFHRWWIEPRSAAVLPLDDAHESMDDSTKAALTRLCEAA